MSLAATLDDGIAQLGLDIAPPTRERLLQYIELIEKWNKVHNLTAVREPSKMVTQHLLDSLAVIPHLTGTRVLDVGSGAGLPGIPLALVRPDWQIGLLDSNHKKAAFLQQAKIELALDNVSVECKRVETWQPEIKFNTVISRAFSDLPEFVRLARHLCDRDGVLVAMKGIYPYDEAAQLPKSATVREVLPLKVPGVTGERHLVFITPDEEGKLNANA